MILVTVLHNNPTESDNIISINNNMSAEPVYQPIILQLGARSRSGLDSIITAENAFYETSLNLKYQWEECDSPETASRCHSYS